MLSQGSQVPPVSLSVTVSVEGRKSHLKVSIGSELLTAVATGYEVSQSAVSEEHAASIFSVEE